MKGWQKQHKQKQKQISKLSKGISGISEKTQERKKRLARLEEILEMPKELIEDEPKITIVGFEQLLIENYKGILEYEEFFIKLKTKIGIIAISGFSLNLEEMTEDDVMITGKIESVDLESIM